MDGEGGEEIGTNSVGEHGDICLQQRALDCEDLRERRAGSLPEGKQRLNDITPDNIPKLLETLECGLEMLRLNGKMVGSKLEEGDGPGHAREVTV